VAVRADEVDAALLLMPPDSPLLFHTPIGQAYLVIVVAPDNPVDNISLAQMRDMFAGTIADWEAVGGPPAPVQPVVREVESSSATALGALLDPLVVSPAARVADDDESVKQMILAIPGSIGYVSSTRLDERVRVMAIDGFPPTPEAVRRHQYPLAAYISFVTCTEPEGQLRDFLTWILSSAGQEVIRRYAIGLDE
jgi:phosphate transport system substrate-binding protein